LIRYVRTRTDGGAAHNIKNGPSNLFTEKHTINSKFEKKLPPQASEINTTSTKIRK
jgi:hypothetical protein